MGTIDWEKYRKADGTLNLILAFDEEGLAHTHNLGDEQSEICYDYFAIIEKQSIISRQAAIVALTSAVFISQMYFVEE